MVNRNMSIKDGGKTRLQTGWIAVKKRFGRAVFP